MNKELTEILKYLRLGNLLVHWEDYLKLFKNVDAETAIGEASVCYLWSPTAAVNIRSRIPDAKILMLAIFPRGLPGDAVRDRLAQVNKLIARLDDQKHVFFMDIGSKFLDDKGVFLPESFRPDNLHPQAKGYDIWGQAVQAKLAELLK